MSGQTCPACWGLKILNMDRPCSVCDGTGFIHRKSSKAVSDIPSEQLIPMDQIDDGSKQRALIRGLNQQVSALQSENEYLKKRLAAAEEVIMDKQRGNNAYAEWKSIVNQDKLKP